MKPKAIKLVMHELERADDKHPPMAEMIEGLHTLKCEVAELEREIMRKNFAVTEMTREAVQVAAMAIKFLRDCCGMEIGQESDQTDFTENDLSDRGRDWMTFAAKVLDHIENYTVPQYGDKGSDRATDYTMKTISEHIGRYKDRMESNSRGTIEAKRDMLKVAHYASFGYNLI